MAKKSKQNKQSRRAEKKVIPKRPLKDRILDVIKSQMFRFLLIFAIFVFFFYLVYYSAFFNKYILDPYVNWLAAVSSGILNIFGAGTTVDKDLLSGSDFSMSIKNGCDGMEVMSLFLGAVIAFPTINKLKIPGLVTGVVVLFILNIIRIVGLYVSGVHFPSLFDMLHIQGGFVIFTAICVLIWIGWANWAMYKEKEIADAAS